MPVAMITASARMGSPFLKESFRLPFCSSILVRLAPARIVDAVPAQPVRHDARARLVHHARQDAGRDFHDGKRGAAREDGVQDGEGDEARPHHHHLAARLDVAR